MTRLLRSAGQHSIEEILTVESSEWSIICNLMLQGVYTPEEVRVELGYEQTN